jgi:hypothetical protein
VLLHEVIVAGASRRYKLISATKDLSADGILVTWDTFHALGCMRRPEEQPAPVAVLDS